MSADSSLCEENKYKVYSMFIVTVILNLIQGLDLFNASLFI